MELKAEPGRCEEAHHTSHEYYIPCNAPAVRLLYCNRDYRVYRMCEPCAHHNLRRGMTDAGVYATTKGSEHAVYISDDVDKFEERMSETPQAFAVVINREKILIETVSPTIRAAQVNGITIYFKIRVPALAHAAEIADEWKRLTDTCAARVEILPVKVTLEGE